jgi:hypothetical protein
MRLWRTRTRLIVRVDGTTQPVGGRRSNCSRIHVDPHRAVVVHQPYVAQGDRLIGPAPCLPDDGQRLLVVVQCSRALPLAGVHGAEVVQGGRLAAPTSRRMSSACS